MKGITCTIYIQGEYMYNLQVLRGLKGFHGLCRFQGLRELQGLRES